MSTGKITKNSKAIYFIIFIIILVAFLLLGGGTWLKGMVHSCGITGMGNWNWIHILVSLGIGFLLGMVASKK